MCKRTSGLMTLRKLRSLDLTVLVLFALAPLSGCTGMRHPPEIAPPPVASTPTLRPAPAPRSAAVKPKKPRDLRPSDVDESPPPLRTASIDPKSLLGLDPDSVEKRLGPPARMENNALSHEWVYSVSGCSFRIFFYPNVNSTSFRALKYGSTKDNGESLDSSDACVRKILTARNNAD